MTRFRLVFALVASTAACSVDLAIPDGVDVTCSETGECPGAYICNSVTNRCVLPSDNAPTVFIEVPRTTAPDAIIDVVVVESDGRDVELAATVVRDGVETPIILTPGTVQGSPKGTQVQVAFDAAGLFGGTAYIAGLTLRLTPTAAGHRGETAEVEFDYGNDAPVAQAVSVVSPGLGQTVAGISFVHLSLLDSAADAVSIEGARLVGDGVVLDIPVSTDIEGSFPEEQLVDLDSSVAAPGVDHVIVWASRVATHASLVGVRLELDLRDAFGGTTTAQTQVFNLANNNAPDVSALASAKNTRRATGVVPLRYVLADDDSDPVDVHVEYSVDLGETWLGCDEYPVWWSEGSRDLATRPRTDGGVGHRFAWDTSGANPLQANTVLVRILASDGETHIIEGDIASLAFGAGVGSATTLADLTPVISAAPINGENLKLVDIDHDGVVDAVYTTYVVLSGTAELHIVRSPVSQGRIVDADVLTDVSTTALPDFGRVLVVADFSGDGFNDILLLISGAAPLHLLTQNVAGGNPLGTFASTPITHDVTGTNVGGVATPDFNADGHADLVVISNTGAVALAWTAPATFTTVAAFGTDIISDTQPLAADFNGDGVSDFAIIGTRRVSIFYGHAGGVPATTPDVTLPFNVDITGAVATDLDRDGRIDLVVGSDHQGELFAVRNSGTSLEPPVILDLGTGFVQFSPWEIRVADLDNDGKEDILDLARNGNQYQIALLTSTGGSAASFASFNKHVLFSALPAKSLDAADLDRDGTLDIVVADGNGLSITFGVRGSPTAELVRDDDPVLARTAREQSFSYTVKGLIDYDGDGTLDVVAREPTGSADTHVFLYRAGTAMTDDLVLGPAPAQLAIAEMTGDDREDVVALFPVDGTTDALQVSTLSPFAGPPSIAVRSSINTSRNRGLTILDADGDGDDDVVEAALSTPPTFTNNHGQLFVNDGTGSLAASFSFTLSADIISMTAADVDGSGRDAMVVSVEDGVRVLAMTSATPPVITVTGNSVAGNIATADFNRDGATDVAVAVQSGSSNFTVINGGHPFAFAGTFIAANNTVGGALLTHDFSGDGTPDLLLSQFNAGLTVGVTPPVSDTSGAPYFGDLVVVNPDEYGAMFAADTDCDDTIDVITVKADQRLRGNDDLPSERLSRRAVSAATAQQDARLLNVPARAPDRFGKTTYDAIGQRRTRVPTCGKAVDLASAFRHHFGDGVLAFLPMTSAWTFHGDVRLTRVIVAGDPASPRLAVEQRWPLDLSGAALASQRGVMVELPLEDWATTTDLADLRVYRRSIDWLRAANVPTDPIAASAGAAGYLPRRPAIGGGFSDVVVEHVDLVEIPRAAGDNLDSGSGPRFAVLLSGGARVIRVLTDRGGIFQAFSVR